MRRIAYFTALAWLQLAVAAGPAAADFETAEAPGAVWSDPFSVRSFGGILTVSIGWDDNVLLVSDLPPFFPGIATRESAYSALSFNGGWRVPLGPDTVLDIGGEISGVYYFAHQRPALLPLSNDPSDYSRYVVHPTVALTHTIDMGQAGKVTLSPSYGFRREGGAKVAAIGLDSHQLRFDASYAPNARSTLSGHLLWASNDFDVVFPLAPTSNRDGDYLEAGLAWRVKPAPSRALTVGAALQSNDAAGTDYEFDGYKVFAEFETHLASAWFGTFGVSWTDRDYTTGFNYLVPAFMPLPRTEQQVLGLSARILKPLDDRRAVQAVLTHDRYGSNAPTFEGERTAIEFSLIVRLP